MKKYQIIYKDLEKAIHDQKYQVGDYLVWLEAGVVFLVFIFSFDLPFNEKDIAKQASQHSK